MVFFQLRPQDGRDCITEEGRWDIAKTKEKYCLFDPTYGYRSLRVGANGEASIHDQIAASHETGSIRGEE